MGDFIGLLGNITDQFDELLVAGQTLIDGISAAMTILTQLAGVASQVIDFLASLQA